MNRPSGHREPKPKIELISLPPQKSSSGSRKLTAK
jgi:hypothetical protein